MGMEDKFDIDQELRELVGELHPDFLYELAETLPPEEAQFIIDELSGQYTALQLPRSPLHQADILVEGFAKRDHLRYLSHRIAQAVRDVEAGQSRKLIVEMPPRSGKSLLATQVTPAWLLASHPSWDVMITSYSRNLATSWGRQIRRWVSEGALGSHVNVAGDAGAVENWETTSGGKVATRSIGSDLTGHGAKVLIIDDPHKNFAEAHSETSRDRVWNWWLSDVQTRLHPPSLVIVIMTRWHEDDLVGRLLSREYEGNSADWERISFPAIATEEDILGRAEGDPLYSPLIDETREQAITRWEDTKRSVGIYTWSALYQQRPAPAEGAIFSAEWWRFWTTDPTLATTDGKTVLVSPTTDLAGGKWVDSWDATFKGADSSDYVVGQRWVRKGANRYLIAQKRARMDFVQTIAEMLKWSDESSYGGTGRYVHERLVEDKANGPAIIATLKDRIAGLKPVNPSTSKEARARAITPEIESGNVYLPHPSEPGNEWVTDLLSEFRNFPNDAHDDQVDAMTQALSHLRYASGGGIVMPGETTTSAGLPGGGSGQTVPGIAVPGYGGVVGGDRVAATQTMGRRI